MQKETTINTLFGKNIYKATIANYETINKNVISDIKSFVNNILNLLYDNNLYLKI